jgi:hypothetical protein
LLAKLGVVILLFASAFALVAPSAHAIDLVVVLSRISNFPVKQFCGSRS